MVDTILSKLSAEHWTIIGVATFILVCFFIFFSISQSSLVFSPSFYFTHRLQQYTFCILIIHNARTRPLTNIASFIFPTFRLFHQATGVARQLHLQKSCVASDSRDEVRPHICTISDSSRLAKST